MVYTRIKLLKPYSINQTLALKCLPDNFKTKKFYDKLVHYIPKTFKIN